MMNQSIIITKLTKLEEIQQASRTSIASPQEDMEDMLPTKLKTPEELKDFCDKINSNKDFKKNLVRLSFNTISSSVSNRLTS